jgi:hypothetical protein
MMMRKKMMMSKKMMMMMMTNEDACGMVNFQVYEVTIYGEFVVGFVPITADKGRWRSQWHQDQEVSFTTALCICSVAL